MMNPFGDDDDDFEVNEMIDWNLQMSYLIVDEMHNEHPELLKDQYWSEMPKKLPDRANHEDAEKAPMENLDVFDVDLKNSHHRISIVPRLVDDLTCDTKASLESAHTTTDPSLIPRRSKIDVNYQNLPEVEAKQSNLEREMEKIRQKTVIIINDSETETESDSQPVSRRESKQSKSSKNSKNSKGSKKD